MQIIDLNPQTSSNLCATIGIFEGVHLAHQALIKECLNLAKEKKLTSCLITFNVQTKLSKTINKIPLFDEEEKINQLSKFGIDKLIIIDLNEEFKQMSHQDFMKLLIKLGVKDLVVGFDFTYGFNQLGNTATIKEDSNGAIEALIIDKKEINGSKIGTRQIKEALALGKVAEANQLLGFPYYIKLISGTSSQLALLRDGKYQILLDDKMGKITIQKGKIINPTNLDNEKITFIKDKE